LIDESIEKANKEKAGFYEEIVLSSLTEKTARDGGFVSLVY